MYIKIYKNIYIYIIIVCFFLFVFFSQGQSYINVLNFIHVIFNHIQISLLWDRRMTDCQISFSISYVTMLISETDIEYPLYAGTI